MKDIVDPTFGCFGLLIAIWILWVMYAEDVRWMHRITPFHDFHFGSNCNNWWCEREERNANEQNR